MNRLDFTRSSVSGLAKYAFWLTLIGLSGWYLRENVFTILTAEAGAGDAFAGRSALRYVHFMAVVPLLLLAPVQFSRKFRSSWPVMHQRAGQIYLSGAILGSLLAVVLAATIRNEGSRIPLTLFGLLWFCFSVAAWQCARNRDFVNHQRFVIRGYGLALAFVWTRLMWDFQAELFPFIARQDVRDTTREWLSVVLPLVMIEGWLTWWPAARRSFLPRVRPA